MWGVIDVLGAVAQRGSLTLDELDAALPGALDTGLPTLDACVDDGLLRLAWTHGASLAGDRYRLTPRGRRLLRASQGCAAAA
jgi:hypothetical protein